MPAFRQKVKKSKHSQSPVVNKPRETNYEIGGLSKGKSSFEPIVIPCGYSSAIDDLSSNDELSRRNIPHYNEDLLTQCYDEHAVTCRCLLPVGGDDDGFNGSPQCNLPAVPDDEVYCSYKYNSQISNYDFVDSPCEIDNFLDTQEQDQQNLDAKERDPQKPETLKKRLMYLNSLEVHRTHQNMKRPATAQCKQGSSDVSPCKQENSAFSVYRRPSSAKEKEADQQDFKNCKKVIPKTGFPSKTVTGDVVTLELVGVQEPIIGLPPNSTTPQKTANEKNQVVEKTVLWCKDICSSEYPAIVLKQPPKEESPDPCRGFIQPRYPLVVTGTACSASSTSDEDHVAKQQAVKQWLMAGSGYYVRNSNIGEQGLVRPKDGLPVLNQSKTVVKLQGAYDDGIASMRPRAVVTVQKESGETGMCEIRDKTAPPLRANLPRPTSASRPTSAKQIPFSEKYKLAPKAESSDYLRPLMTMNCAARVSLINRADTLSVINDLPESPAPESSKYACWSCRKKCFMPVSFRKRRLLSTHALTSSVQHNSSIAELQQYSLVPLKSMSHSSLPSCWRKAKPPPKKAEGGKKQQIQSLASDPECMVGNSLEPFWESKVCYACKKPLTDDPRDEDKNVVWHDTFRARNTKLKNGRAKRDHFRVVLKGKGIGQVNSGDMNSDFLRTTSGKEAHNDSQKTKLLNPSPKSSARKASESETRPLFVNSLKKQLKQIHARFADLHAGQPSSGYVTYVELTKRIKADNQTIEEIRKVRETNKPNILQHDEKIGKTVSFQTDLFPGNCFITQGGIDDPVNAVNAVPAVKSNLTSETPLAETERKTSGSSIQHDETKQHPLEAKSESSTSSPAVDKDEATKQRSIDGGVESSFERTLESLESLQSSSGTCMNQTENLGYTSSSGSYIFDDTITDGRKFLCELGSDGGRSSVVTPPTTPSENFPSGQVAPSASRPSESNCSQDSKPERSAVENRPKGKRTVTFPSTSQADSKCEKSVSFPNTTHAVFNLPQATFSTPNQKIDILEHSYKFAPLSWKSNASYEVKQKMSWTNTPEKFKAHEIKCSLSKLFFRQKSPPRFLLLGWRKNLTAKATSNDEDEVDDCIKAQMFGVYDSNIVPNTGKEKALSLMQNLEVTPSEPINPIALNSEPTTYTKHNTPNPSIKNVGSTCPKRNSFNKVKTKKPKKTVSFVDQRHQAHPIDALTQRPSPISLRGHRVLGDLQNSSPPDIDTTWQDIIENIHIHLPQDMTSEESVYELTTEVLKRYIKPGSGSTMGEGKGLPGMDLCEAINLARQTLQRGGRIRSCQEQRQHNKDKYQITTSMEKAQGKACREKPEEECNKTPSQQWSPTQEYDGESAMISSGYHKRTIEEKGRYLFRRTHTDMKTFNPPDASVEHESTELREESYQALENLDSIDVSLRIETDYLSSAPENPDSNEVLSRNDTDKSSMIAPDTITLSRQTTESYDVDRIVHNVTEASNWTDIDSDVHLTESDSDTRVTIDTSPDIYVSTDDSQIDVDFQNELHAFPDEEEEDDEDASSKITSISSKKNITDSNSDGVNEGLDDKTLASVITKFCKGPRGQINTILNSSTKSKVSDRIKRRNDVVDESKPKKLLSRRSREDAISMRPKDSSTGVEGTVTSEENVATCKRRAGKLIGGTDLDDNKAFGKQSSRKIERLIRYYPSKAYSLSQKTGKGDTVDAKSGQENGFGTKGRFQGKGKAGCQGDPTTFENNHFLPKTAVLKMHRSSSFDPRTPVSKPDIAPKDQDRSTHGSASTTRIKTRGTKPKLGSAKEGLRAWTSNTEYRSENKTESSSEEDCQVRSNCEGKKASELSKDFKNMKVLTPGRLRIKQMSKRKLQDICRQMTDLEQSPGVVNSLKKAMSEMNKNNYIKFSRSRSNAI